MPTKKVSVAIFNANVMYIYTVTKEKGGRQSLLAPLGADAEWMENFHNECCKNIGLGIPILNMDNWYNYKVTSLNLLSHTDPHRHEHSQLLCSWMLRLELKAIKI